MQAITFISVVLLCGALLPAAARAGIFGDMVAFFAGEKAEASAVSRGNANLQSLALPRPAMNIDPTPARGGGDITIVDGSALLPQEGPSGTIADIDKPTDSTISTYIVRPGDTITVIADMFKVSPNTILSANDLPSGTKLQVGQKLIILPVTGIKYTVKRGDTLATVAKRYGGDVTEITIRNGIEDGQLAVGTEIIIPNGEIPLPPAKSKSSTARKGVPASSAHGVGARGSAAQIGYYMAPLANYTETQGVHGYNAVDLAAPSGTPVYASAAGTVTVARAGGWNGGYGSYVVISHGNGSQTLYSHMSKVAAYDGETVSRGDVIGYVGKTGLATGSHLHFEIRNGIRNPF